MIDLSFQRRLAACSTLALLAAVATSQVRSEPSEPTPNTGEERIAWFGTLESARAEAARTNRPIFLLAARPCSGQVPGFW